MDEEWFQRFFIDKKTGRKHRIYKFRGRPCKRVVLKSKICDQLAGYALIQKDLKSAIDWMKEIERIHSAQPKVDGGFFYAENREAYDLVKGLFVASLTFYGKCFSKCDGRPVKLEKRQLDEKFHRLHDLGIKYRHNFAAHSGAEKLEVARVVVVAPDKWKKGRDLPYRIMSEIEQPDLVWQDEKDAVVWVELFEHVREFVLNKGQQLHDKIVESEILPNGVESIFKVK
ncbi:MULTISPECIES: hypothetical protein [Pseudomonas]|uniref:hypothetical protein n=1 Tax=Pseudomonas TaxID=286 RepID=UPI0015F8EC5B|nr:MULTISPECIES: hypothetical protein [Pseudomonas]MBA6138187.1 hypothetical protein [Pseudomonas monteilii]MDT3747728.1 hypothetical protein [Pseudomonas kurunegalensis]